jgi:hypothetical protein
MRPSEVRNGPSGWLNRDTKHDRNLLETTSVLDDARRFHHVV